VEDAIDKLSNFDADTATVYKSRFASYAIYATHETNTNTKTEEVEPFATKAEYETYKTDVVFVLVNNTMSIATSENTLIGSINTNKSIIDSKRTANYITDAEQTYLKNVLDSIYETYTNAEVEDTAIAASNATNGGTEATAVSDICNKIYEIDAAQKLLNETTIPEYIANFYMTFMDNYYEAIYGDAKVVWDKFYSNNSYSASINEVLAPDFSEPDVVDSEVAYMVTIQAKAEETCFYYALPEEFTYEKFQEFYLMLESQNIAARMKVLCNWVELDYDGDGEEDGGINALMYTAFDELDSKRLEVARDYYGNAETGLITTKFNSYKEAYPSKEAALRYEYNTYRNYIWSVTAKRTADVIHAYNTACCKFARICALYELENYYNALIPTAEGNNRKADLDVAYDNIKAAINAATYEVEIVTKINDYKAQLDAAAEDTL
jgi:hypothetical protein